MVEPKVPKAKSSSEPGISANRIRTIMKSTEDTEKISTEGLHLMTKATEMFIQHLAQKSLYLKNTTTLKYEHLSQLVSEKENLEFLLQIIPQKITVKEFKEILNKDDKDSDNSSSEESEDSVPSPPQPKKISKK